MIPETYLKLLQEVANANSRSKRVQLIKQHYKDPKFIKAIKLVCKNTVKCKVPLSIKDKRRLRPHAKTISKIAKSKTNGKQTIIQNGGGFLSILIPIVTSLLGAAFNGKMVDGA